MAELISECCTAEAQTACCEPDQKAGCCDPATHATGTCGCAADQPATADDVREAVRECYAAAARAAATGTGCCSAGSEVTLTDAAGTQVFGTTLYDGAETSGTTDDALSASLGCGVPTAVADLHAGEIVLDLGSGAGADVLISASRVGPTGKAYGLDMTDEMLDLARTNAAKAGADNVEFLKGYIEAVPLPDGTVDVVISNCVVNLVADKDKVFAEAARVLRPGGRLAISDVVADAHTDDAARADMAAWTGCIAGALTREEFERGLAAAGFADVEITETHRVHEHASSAIVRARRA